MSQSFTEIAKELTLAAINNGHIFRHSNGVTGNLNATELNQLNADEIGKYYRTVAKHVAHAFNGNYED